MRRNRTVTTTGVDYWHQLPFTRFIKLSAEDSSEILKNYIRIRLRCGYDHVLGEQRGGYRIEKIGKALISMY